MNTSCPFTDVPTDAYYYDAVKWAVSHGITNGMDAAHFGPDEPCTRAQVVTFLWRAHGEKAASSYYVFSDTPVDSYYFQAVNWATAQGITNGTDRFHFSPDDSCTRAQVVTFLWRLADSPKGAKAAAFSDVKSGAWYAEAVAWAVQQGVTKGVSDTSFAPSDPCTRAQTVTFLYRQLGK